MIRAGSVSEAIALIAFAVLASFGASSAAVAPRDSAGASPSDEKHHSWLAAAAAADSGVVWRLEATPGDSTRGSAPRWNRPASRGVVTGDWIRRFAAFVAATPYFASRHCEHGHPPDSTAVVLGVRLKGAPPVSAAVFLPQQGCGELLAESSEIGGLDLSGRRAALVELAAEALPQDTALAALRRRLAALPPGAPDGPTPALVTYVEVLPQAIEKVPPEYPRSARKDGVRGTVLILALVARDGTVADVRVKESIPALDAAAVNSVRRWKFRPATTNGKPVAVWVAIPVKFTLH